MNEDLGFILANMQYLEDLSKKGYRYIAMDECGYVYAYTRRPPKNEELGVWHFIGGFMRVVSSAICFGLSWEDMGATPIADKIKEYERFIDSQAKENTNEQQADMVNHPSHYTMGTIEPKDFIRGQGLNFNRGNVIKYTVRAGRKDKNKEIEDLKKAKQYLEFEIEYLEGQK